MCGLAQNGPNRGNPGETGPFHDWRHGKAPRFRLDGGGAGEGLRRGVAGDGRRGL